MDTAQGRTPEQRRATTRGALLKATVTCLVEHGYARTTTQRIQDLAGVSRGALLHHFPAKNDLLVAAINHVAEQQIERIRTKAHTIRNENNRTEQGISILHAAMSGPLFLAGLELWMAARTDPNLKAALIPVERDVGRILHELVTEVFGSEITNTAIFPSAYESLLQMLRGLALTSILREDKNREEQVLRTWPKLLT